MNRMSQVTKPGIQFGVSLLPQGAGEIEVARAADVAEPLHELVARAAALRDAGHGHLVTYSRKVFIPLARLYRDARHYCTFATAPGEERLESLLALLDLHLNDLSRAIECGVLVWGDDKDARETVVRLANDADLRGVHAGPLANSAAAETLTSVLIAINRHYKVPAASLRISGVFEPR